MAIDFASFVQNQPYRRRIVIVTPDTYALGRGRFFQSWKVWVEPHFINRMRQDIRHGEVETRLGTFTLWMPTWSPLEPARQSHDGLTLWCDSALFSQGEEFLGGLKWNKPEAEVWISEDMTSAYKSWL